MNPWSCKKVTDLKAFEAEAHEGGARLVALEQGIQFLLISLRKMSLEVRFPSLFDAWPVWLFILAS